MTREHFIKKWLGNPEKQYTEQHMDEMRDDLDAVIDWAVGILRENLTSELPDQKVKKAPTPEIVCPKCKGRDTQLLSSGNVFCKTLKCWNLFKSL
jgi:hypothetical protein